MADIRVKSYEDRIQQTPNSKVVWSGERGRSDCYTMDLEILDLLQSYGQECVRYDSTGEPNFKPFTEVEVKISDMSGDRQKNFNSAYKKILTTEYAKEKGLKTPADVKRFFSDNQLTIHECSDGVTIQVVPTVINATFGHSGGVSEWREIQNESVSKGNFGRDIGKEIGTSKIYANRGMVRLEETMCDGSQFLIKNAQNIGNEFVSGAKDMLVESSISLTVEAVHQMIEVANGKKNAGDAVKEMGKITVDVAVIGGTDRLLKNATKSALKGIATDNDVVQIIEVAKIVQESAVKYINGEINEKEFIEGVGKKGATMVARMIGGQIGKEIGGLVGGIIGTTIAPGAGTMAGYVAGEVVGEILGTIITTVACSAIISVYDTSKNLDSYKLADRQIKKLEKEALREMENQRKKFKSIVQREYRVWDERIQEGFDQIVSNACKETFDIQGVSEGLDKVLSIFGKSVTFKNLEQYEAQLDMPLKLRF